MAADFNQHDPKTLWQNQPTETHAMTLEQIREKARALQAKNRREMARNMAATLLVVAAFVALGLAQARDNAQQIVFLIAIVWALAGQYLLNRSIWLRRPVDFAAVSGIETCRYEMDRRRAFFRRILPWSSDP